MRELGVQIESWGPFAEGRNNLFTDPPLTEIGDAHGKSVAQVVLRWLIQRDVIVIPKSVRPERMRENIDVFDFEPHRRGDGPDRRPGHGRPLFFDHRDPAMVSWLGERRLDGSPESRRGRHQALHFQTAEVLEKTPSRLSEGGHEP